MNKASKSVMIYLLVVLVFLTISFSAWIWVQTSDSERSTTIVEDSFVLRTGNLRLTDFKIESESDLILILSQKYLDSCDWINPKSLLTDIHTIDRMKVISTDDPYIQLTELLTVRLEERIGSDTMLVKSEVLKNILNWSGQLGVCKEVLDGKSAKIFRMVSRHWMNWVAANLSVQAKNNPSIKYQFWFKNLVQKCHEFDVYPEIGNSKMEKITQNFIDSNFSYLFNRFWNSTTIYYKFLVLSLVLFFSYTTTVGIYFTMNKVKNILYENYSNY